MNFDMICKIYYYQRHMLAYKSYYLGCKVNAYDSGRFSQWLKVQGLVEVIEGADLAIIHTCSVTASAQAKNREVIKKAKRENPQARILLAGCWPRVETVDPKEHGVDMIVNDENDIRLLDFLAPLKAESNTQAEKKSIPRKARYTIKIQDGCEQFCSYCVIPFARGPLKSRGREEVLAEVKEAIAAGHGEIVLSGIHIGLYGYPGDYRLADLVEEILALPGLGRIRLSSIEVGEVSEKLINLMATNRRFCRHLHLPLQSGSDKILKLMNRPYDSASFRKKIALIREAIPDIALTSDVIVGFPGEALQDFEASLRMVKETEMARVHAFPFSAHSKAPASRMPGQIDEDKKKRRVAQLMGQSSIQERNFVESFIGKTLDVVVENRKHGMRRLKTEYYFDLVDRGDAENKEETGKIKSIEFSGKIEWLA